MPLIDPIIEPNFSSALKSAGLLSSNPEESLQQSLDKVGLSKVEVLDTVANIMRGAETSQTRLKAAEIGLKLNGMMSKDDNAVNVPHVTIVIRDSHHQVNPILIPRNTSKDITI